jgi:hypothetical protein
MSFFDSVPDVADLAGPEPRRGRWRGDSDDTLGAPVQFTGMLACTDELAICVCGLVAFPAGFIVNVVALSRLDPPREPMSLLAHGPGFAPGGAGMFRFGMGFSDGTKVTDGTRRGRSGPAEPGQRILRPRGGSSGGRRSTVGFWCAPLPPPGPMSFVCQWPARGVEEAAVQLEAQLVLDAAARASAIWPEDADLPEEEEQPRGRGGGGFWASGGGGASNAPPVTFGPTETRLVPLQPD